MAGTVVIGTLSDGTNSTSATNCIQGSAKAWVNFNGTSASPITPRASYNVGSVTKNSTGRYTVNFTAALSDANYAAVASCSANGAGGQTVTTGSGTYSTAAVSIGCTDTINNISEDEVIVNVAIFR